MIQGTCGENLKWTLNDEGTLTIGGTGEMEDYSHVRGAEHYPEWYDERDSIKKIIIHDGITKIGTTAFSDCKSLKSIKLPDSLTAIDEYAFCSCESLTEITIPAGVTKIFRDAFSK
ncbi:MAG: leucine-rich repeat domain-containing protein [Selenomonadaceae bacterium]|nr:leucine-rich repeat domain-containing protein [Selenomonadaceae bacterium]